MTSLFVWTRLMRLFRVPARRGSGLAPRGFGGRVGLIGLVAVLACWASLSAGERAPDLGPAFPAWAPYPGLPLNSEQLHTWNDADHMEATGGAYGVYTNNIGLRRVKNREDSYLRAQGRLAVYTAPGDPGFHFSMAGEASRVQFAKHDQFSGNEFAGALRLRLNSDSFAFGVDYTGGQRVVPDEDHFSLDSDSYHEKRVVQEFHGALGFGSEWLGVMGESQIRAADYPGQLAGRNDFIATENVVRLGMGLTGGAGVFAREIFPMDYRFQQVRGRFDARPIQRLSDIVWEVYGLEYFGTVHLLHPDDGGGGPIDPAFALGWGVGTQFRYQDFLSLRVEGAPIRVEMLGENSIDHPGWLAAYWNVRMVIAPWDAFEVHLSSHSGLTETRSVAYAQSTETTFGLTWFFNRNLDTGIDYSYLSTIASRHDYGMEGDHLLIHVAWRYADNWATDFRIETRKRQSNGFKSTLNYNETRVVWGLVYKY